MTIVLDLKQANSVNLSIGSVNSNTNSVNSSTDSVNIATGTAAVDDRYTANIFIPYPLIPSSSLPYPFWSFLSSVPFRVSDQ